ncbi:linear amide C-N hydrolase [Planctomicrobium piriforme]|uniref:Choloylglycine hydrolase n=1 Tax=Planctomicrobium piriforme TaxID=1576369 RepID=A0A1I3SYD8_9PLAN|nr:choloylglycine hydrolase family protein [Planctomicrobium piriforme]SFJ63450.1 choloylglycine hydrolase [Planctomicrobium piriforme]
MTIKAFQGWAACGLILLLAGSPLLACTGITLTAKDGTVVYGRTMEWGSFDIKSRIMVVGRGTKFTGSTPDAKPGLTWTGKYGAAGIEMMEQSFFGDGMNEHGLAVGLFYLPGFAEYQPYDPAQASKSIGPGDVAQYLLTTCRTIAEVEAALKGVFVVPTMEPTLGFPPPVHYLITEPTGKQIAVEYVKGQLHIHPAELGVITNSPTYDWHMTNMRNFINLSPVALPGKEIKDLDFKPLGGGSGMIGLPGDFTPPSRFVRAVAFSSTARPTKDGPETIYEMFRILDNFDVPLGNSEGTGTSATTGLRSATAWTVANDTRNLAIYYHTQNNRRVRKVDMKAMDFAKVPAGIKTYPLDEKKEQDIQDRTPSF